MRNICLAIDIGASSGRHIVGWREEGEIYTKEVYRFPNGVHQVDGHLVWDIEALLREVKNGIRAAKAEFPDIQSLSVDTWGVDYVLLRGDSEILPVYAYRDGRTEAVISPVHEKMPFSVLYRHTGWMLCGTNSIGEATAEKMKEFRLVVWGMHGIYGAGKTMDETFGLIETVEKAAQIYMLTAHLPRVNTIRDDHMVELAEHFGVDYRKDFLYL